MNDKISIIVPIYKVELYLRECIESLMRQTYKNIEIILVNDGSPDKCPEICEEYAMKDNRIKVIHKKNGGLSEARNCGIENAIGSYIAFVDSDDFVKKDMYEVLYNLLKNNDADISVCGYKCFKNENKIKSDIIKETIEIYNKHEAILELLRGRKLEHFAWNKLYKKALFDNVKYPVGKYMEDLGTTYKLFDISNKIVYTSSIKYFYRQRKTSIMANKNEKFYNDLYDLSKELNLYVKKNYPSDKDLSDKILIQGILNLLKIKNDEEARNTLKELINNNNLSLSLMMKIKIKIYKFSPRLYICINQVYVYLKNIIRIEKCNE